MSLLRLLTTGKSLVGLKKSEPRYHLPCEQTLPKFGSKKNPFRATVLPEKHETVPAPAGSGLKGSVGACVEAMPEAPAKGQLPDNAQKPQAPPGIAQENQAACEQSGPSENPDRRPSAVRAFLLWARAKKAKTAPTSGKRSLVQGELSLDKVKVIRNDLSESDLEVIRVKATAPSPNAASSLKSAKDKTESEPGWGAAAGRLLGFGKM